jgi:pimeloyl-ACP methyl ester carboxylesterase
LYRQLNALNPRRPQGFLGRPPPGYKGSMHGPIAATGRPVLFVVGEHDLITSPAMIREAAGLIPGSRVHEIEGAGHNAYFESAAEFNRVLAAHLSDAEAAAGAG